MPIASAVRQPTLFLAHGGGPLPLLGDARHTELIRFMKSVPYLLPAKPTSIVCVTAHWETDVVTVSTNPAPPMLYDYGGFPEESYRIQYPAPGNPVLARRILGMLKDAGIPVREDSKRGFDHGTFVPLKLIYPAADIPVVQLSILRNMDPSAHVQVGKVLSALRDENVFILGSGSSFHNLRLMMATLFGGPASPQHLREAQAFDDYLTQAVASKPTEREALLNRWDSAPGARMAQPREDHLVPLHVIAGAAGEDAGSKVHSDVGLGFPLSSYLFTGPATATTA